MKLDAANSPRGLKSLQVHASASAQLPAFPLSRPPSPKQLKGRRLPTIRALLLVLAALTAAAACLRSASAVLKVT